MSDFEQVRDAVKEGQSDRLKQLLESSSEQFNPLFLSMQLSLTVKNDDVETAQVFWLTV